VRCTKRASRHIIVGSTFNFPGNTRWWSSYKLYDEVKLKWDDAVDCIETAVNDAEVYDGGARIGRLQDSLSVPAARALIVIAAKPLVEATYLLEGDGATSLIAYDQIMRIDRWLRTHMPNMTFPGLDLAIGAHALFLVNVQHQHGGDVAAAM
jgi:hypothetical protein